MVVDTHRLEWKGQEYPGGAVTVAVGLYDGTTMERLPAYAADGQRWPADCVVFGDVTIK
jgi:hypothetical protein